MERGMGMKSFMIEDTQNGGQGLALAHNKAEAMKLMARPLVGIRRLWQGGFYESNGLVYSSGKKYLLAIEYGEDFE